MKGVLIFSESSSEEIGRGFGWGEQKEEKLNEIKSEYPLCHKAKQRCCIYSTYDFMISHHIIKLLINFFILFFCVRSEDI